MDCLHQLVEAEWLQGGTQPADMDIYRARSNDNPVSPYFIQQFFPPVYLIRVRHEEMQQAELGWSQEYRYSVCACPV